jgi:predicted nucleotide-binding protein (sugar kinase/HSP70/actin superfamily)
MPPKPSQKTIDLGVKYSPEFACFPLKVIMGSYIEALEAGADVLVTSGGHGPCRAGFYAEVHKRILNSLGYKFDMIVFDEISRGYLEFYRNFKRLKAHNSFSQVFNAVKLVYNMIHQIDAHEKVIEQLRAYEINTGDCAKAWDEIQNIYDGVSTQTDLLSADEAAKDIINSIKVHKAEEHARLKVGIVGEIYVVMEPSINMKIEEVLGNLGVEVERSQYLSQWVDYNLVPHRFSKPHELEILKKGERFIKIVIGGHAKQTVGHIVDFKERGFDGVVHLMPFACLPELVSQSIIPQISKELDMPVITLSLDEQTGITNTLTRVEAFVDLIRNKKNKESA